MPDPKTPDPKKSRVIYQCSCGQQVELIESDGGACESCGHMISPKVLGHDLAMTMTLGACLLYTSDAADE